MVRLNELFQFLVDLSERGAITFKKKRFLHDCIIRITEYTRYKKKLSAKWKLFGARKNIVD